MDEKNEGPRVGSAEIRDVSRLRRSRNDRYVAGVAGGLARHLDIDPVILRVLFVVLTFFGGAGLVVYGALWLLVPAEDQPTAKIDLDERSLGVALLAVLAIGGLLVVSDSFDGDGGPGFWLPFPILVIALITWLVLRHRERRRAWQAPDIPPPGTPGSTVIPPVPPLPPVPPYAGLGHQLAHEAQTNPEIYRDSGAWKVTGDPRTGFAWQRDPRKRGPKLFFVALPLIALALGILGAVDLSGVDVAGSAYPALALGVVAALLLLGAFWGRAGGLILVGLLLVPVTAAATAADNFHGDDITYTPTDASQLPADGVYSLELGKLVVDLTGFKDPATLDDRTIEASVEVGEVEVIVPAGVDVVAHADIDGPGGFDLFDHSGGGIDISGSHTLDVPDEVATLHIEASADLGHIIVRSK